MKLHHFGIALALIMLLAAPAYALDLQQARAAGSVGEKLDGYVSARSDAPDVQALVADVNGKRRAEYTRISKENNQPVDIVAKLAAEQIINGLAPGAYYQAPDGSWKKR
ncbi:MAG TPA: YdbL family protein [Alphaproteobacteria bacterium]|nr:YdbL family protein [Alphaproteobacteria bacterium]